MMTTLSPAASSLAVVRVSLSWLTYACRWAIASESEKRRAARELAGRSLSAGLKRDGLPDSHHIFRTESAWTGGARKRGQLIVGEVSNRWLWCSPDEDDECALVGEQGAKLDRLSVLVNNPERGQVVQVLLRREPIRLEIRKDH